MQKQYSRASDDVVMRIAAMKKEWHPDLEKVTVGALFIYEPITGEKVLTHQGYPAAAMVRIVSARDRAAGLPDAQIIIDRAVWQELALKQKSALIDHELYHLEPQFDGKVLRCDAQDRPVLRIRKHDWQLGVFDEIARRHGEHSMEARSARAIVEATGQLYFQFAETA